ncbi:hypothetical protein ACFL27_05075 [candidate division CSSED10-310 bacterium]|uniref:HPr kinase/phosphorylase C-terminal domain-containing protein n=1 Tax=candidate division CSSED10-310 bacterium TaxID=2855610 RepID=A0ABV6YTN5_UNCC1
MFRPHNLSRHTFLDFKKRAQFSECYLFFDSVVRIFSNHRENLQPFDQMYRHFRSSAQSIPPAAFHNDYYVLTDMDSSGQNIIFWRPDIFWEIMNDESPLHEAENIIFDAALSRSTSHLLFHGASFCFEQQGIGICGISGTGKTTLALELARRGFQLLSDEIIALHKIEGNFQAFPRIIACDDNTRRLIDEENSYLRLPQTDLHQGKVYFIDPWQLKNQLKHKSCPGQVILFLEPALDDLNLTAKDHGSLVEVAVLANSPEFLTQIINIPEVSLIKRGQDPDGGGELITFFVGQEQRRAFRKICQAMKENIAYCVHRTVTSPDPDREPQLEPFNKKEALKHLLSYLRNVSTPFYFDENLDKSSAMASISEVLVQAMRFTFYRLRPGNLSKTADLVESLLVKRSI